MTTPTGSPAWTRSAEATVYGGHQNKRDYQAQGVVNPQTDVSAAEFKRLCADLAAVVRVAPFAVVRLSCDDSTPAEPTVHAVFQQTGTTTTDYSGDNPPEGFPAVTRNGDGDVTIAWDADYKDDYGEIAPIAIRFAQASLLGSAAGSVVHEIVDDHTLRLRAFLADGSAAQDAEISIEVWA